MMNPYTILILGENEIFCQGLSRILSRDYRILSIFSDITLHDRLEYALNSQSHLFLIEAHSPSTAIATARSIRIKRSNARIIIMVDESSRALRDEALASGVDGVVLKHAPPGQLKNALERLMNGAGTGRNRTDPLPLVGNHAEHPENRPSRHDFAALTRRELEIVGHLVTGESNKVIARNLAIAEATVKTHLKIVLRKLRVDGRTKAALYALRHGLTTLSGSRAGEL